MAVIPGSTTVGGFVAPSDTADTYPSHTEEYGRGGYRSVPNLAARNAITQDRRSAGMLVYQRDTGDWWQLGPGLSNADWEEPDFPGGGGTQPQNYLIKADITERNAIPAPDRKAGLLVHTLSDSGWWELGAGLSNSDWFPAGFLRKSTLGAVLLQRGNYDPQWFYATADTNAARTVALKAAMTVAATDLAVKAAVTLMYGQFAVNSGEPITSYAPTNAVIVFGPESSVLYANEVDAASDPRMYPGEVRYARNFGAASTVADNQPRFQAALFSMPSTGAPVYQPAEYPTMQTRRGILYLEGDTHTIKKSIWITGYQHIIGLTGRKFVIGLGEGFAPEAGDEKFGIETACWLPGGGAPFPPGEQQGANFSFDIHILNITIANQHVLNTKASGLRYGCGQGGKLDVNTSSMGMRGIYMLTGTSHIPVYQWGIANSNPNPALRIEQRGPHLSGDGVFNCQFFISEEFLNNFPVADHLQYTIGGVTVPLACVMFNASPNLRFPNCAGESNGNYMYFKSCHGTKIGQISHIASNVSGNGGCVVRFDNCINAGFESILCGYFEYAYIANSIGASYREALNSPFFPYGPFNTTGDTFIAIAGNPTTSHVPANSSRDVLNTLTGVASRWINNGGTLQSVAYT